MSHCRVLALNAPRGEWPCRWSSACSSRAPCACRPAERAQRGRGQPRRSKMTPDEVQQ
jgi:hypothetical protein